MSNFKQLFLSVIKSLKQGFELLNKERIFAYLILIIFILVTSSLIIWLHLKVVYTPKTFSINHPKDIFETFYMMVVTWGTVGYGDKLPPDWFSKVIVMVVILLSMIVTPMLSASITSFMVTNKLKQAQGMGEVNFEDHIIICGWNRSGKLILDRLYLDRLKTPINIVLLNHYSPEMNQEIIEQYPKIKIQFVHGDPTSKVVLQRANITKAKSVLMLADTSAEGMNKSDERILLATLAIRHMAPKVWICADLIHAANREHLIRAQANEIIITSNYNPFLLYSSVVVPGLVRFVDYLLAESITPPLSHRNIPKEFIGKTFGELFKHLYQTEQLILIGLLEHTKTVRIEDILSEDMTAIDQFIQEKFQNIERFKTGNDKDIIPHINPHPNTELTKNHIAIVLASSQKDRESVQW